VANTAVKVQQADRLFIGKLPEKPKEETMFQTTQSKWSLGVHHKLEGRV